MTDFENKAVFNVQRDTGGRFLPGSGGRPLGAKGKVARAKLELVKGMTDHAIVQLFRAVQAGERWAVEYVINRSVATSRTIEFEGVSAADLEAAIAAGDISPDEARSLSVALRNLREIEDLDQIKAKLIELEAAIAIDERKG